MKHFSTLTLGIFAGFCSLFAAPAAADNAPKITIEQINDGTFSPHYIYGVHPLNDGESYSQLSADGRRIIRSSFKTGQETGVLFDLDKARGAVKLERIDGYIMSPDEKKILLRTKTTPVYRRTSLAVYYIYDVANDESKVPVYRMQMFEGMKPALEEYAEYPGTYDYKYPIAGADNSKVSVHSYDLLSRATRQLAVPVDSDGYVPRIVGTSDPERLAVVTLNRHQNRMDLYMVNPRSGMARLALRETDKRYLREQAYTALRFYPGHFALLSERTGYQHLYWYTLNGQLETTVTKGDFEVSQFYGYNERDGRFYYAAHKDSPLRTAVYATDKRRKTTCLTPESGTHEVTFSGAGRTQKTLIDNAQLRKKVEDVGVKQEFFTFALADGTQLNGWMVKPRDFDPKRKYPVVMYQYSGPGSQEVKDAWGTGFYGGGVWEAFLAQNGYISVIVDGRGTGARGADFEKCTYLRLGDLESQDQVAAATYLGRLPYVDASRIAIWGWSFGGFNTLMAMTQGTPLFRCGVAVAAPSNWKFYDTVYTERYLLLIHGTADDNVHYRNCAQMSEALVQAGKPFDMQVYTNRNHSIYGGATRTHLFKRIFHFLERNMK